MDVDQIINNGNIKTIFNVKIGNAIIPITDSIIMMWIISILIIILALYFTNKLKKIPSGKQNLIETFIDFVKNICSDSIGQKGTNFVPYIGTMLIFLIVANLVDLVNVFIFKIDIIPPTKDLSIVIGLAIVSISSVIISGIYYKRFGGWLKSFFKPVVFMFPFKIIDYFLKPFSLTLRLFGNISVSFLIMAVIMAAIPFAIPSVLSLYFDIFDGLLQAYIFVFLTALYIGEAIED